jgi:hypothetical protein
MSKKPAGVLLFILGIIAAIGWSFLEKPHYESAQSGLGGDLVDKGSMLWQPESGFALHTVLVQFIALGLGAFGVMMVARRAPIE